MITAKYKTPEGWIDFDFSSVNHMSRNHVINLFSNSIQVVANEGDMRIVNSESLLSQYKRQKKKVMLITDCNPSEKKFVDIGFLCWHTLS